MGAGARRRTGKARREEGLSLQARERDGAEGTDHIITATICKLPAHRRGITYSPKLAGTRVYITINPEAPAAPLEVWIDVEHREGSVLVGIGHALARVASLALQAGTPPAQIVKAWRGVTGQPGAVEDCDGIESAESLPDLVAQVLAAHLEACR